MDRLAKESKKELAQARKQMMEQARKPLDAAMATVGDRIAESVGEAQEAVFAQVFRSFGSFTLHALL